MGNKRTWKMSSCYQLKLAKKKPHVKETSLTQYFAIVLSAINYFTNDVWF